jgi:transposase
LEARRRDLARRPIEMRKIREVVRLKLDRKASVREIAAACGIGHTTVEEYLHRAKAAGLSWPLPEGLSDQELQRLLFPPRRKSDEPCRPMPDYSFVRSELAQKGMTLLLIWQEYKARHPDGYGYSRFAELYTNWEKTTDVRMLQRHKAGHKAFVDWAGLKISITDQKTGQIWEAPVFVSALGASQYLFAKAYENEQLRWWLRGHVEAFEFYGAVPEIVVPDNPRTGVEKACRYEPTLNPSYADLAQFYEVGVFPARVKKPRDKAKVENGVLQVERWVLAPLRNRTFFSLDEANEAIAAQLSKVNERVMKGPELSRRQLFEQEDLPAMRPLPPGRYSYAAWKRVKLGPDYHVEVEGHLYSVPFGLVGRPVDVRMGAGTVEVFCAGKRVASHLRSLSRRGYTTDPDHMPDHHRQQAEWTPARMIRWARAMGPNTAAFAQALLTGKVHPEHGFRMCMGVVNLGKRFSKERLDAACAKALSLGAFSYQSVKSILERNLEGVPAQPSLLPLPSHDNVRGGDYYAKEAAPCVK